MAWLRHDCVVWCCVVLCCVVQTGVEIFSSEGVRGLYRGGAALVIGGWVDDEWSRPECQCNRQIYTG
jgi:hypothetical protein